METIINNTNNIILRRLKKAIRKKVTTKKLKIYKDAYNKGCNDMAKSIYKYIDEILLYDEEDIRTNLQNFFKDNNINI